MIDKLFKSVFFNIYLLNTIYKFVRLYEKNEVVIFENRKELLNYGEREYISSIKFIDEEYTEMIQEGDLPIGGVLKSVLLNRCNLSSIHGHVIPMGVEILTFFGYSPPRSDNSTPFSTLPSSIHTIKNAAILKPCKSENIDHFYISENITYVSFIDCPNVSGKSPYLDIPNTIKTLKFNYDWNNDGIKLVKGDIPEGVTKLSIAGYNFNHGHHKDGVVILPSSIVQLRFAIFDFGDDNDHKSNGIFDFISPTIQILYVHLDNGTFISPLSNLTSLNCITKLTLDLCDGSISKKLFQNSIPNSVTYLSIIWFSGTIHKDIIPNSVTKLKLLSSDSDLITSDTIPSNLVSLKLNQIIHQHGLLPESITSLRLFSSNNSNEEDDETITNNLNQKISNLSKSLLSITLPDDYKEYNLNIPKNIKIKYKPNN